MNVSSSNNSGLHNSTSDDNINISSSYTSESGVPSADTNGFTMHILLVVQVILMLLIFTGNSFILLAIRQGKLMRRVTYYFIGNLAVADLCFGLALGLRLIFMLTDTLNTNSCVLILVIAVSSGLSSATGILFLSLESFLAVRHYIVFKTGFTPKVALGLILGSWVWWGVFCLLTLYHPGADTIPGAQCTIAHPYFNNIFINGFWVSLTSLIVAILTIQVFTIYLIKMHSQKLLQNQQLTGQQSEQQKRMLGRISAMSQLTAIILISFLLTYGPYTLALMLKTTCPQCGVTGQHLVLFSLIGSINSFINVLIFERKSKEFRKAFRSMLRCDGNSIYPVN